MKGSDPILAARVRKVTLAYPSWGYKRLAVLSYRHPDHGWWCPVTVIGYFSCYLLTLHLSPSNHARALIQAIDQVRAEAEQFHWPLKGTPNLATDNGSNFLSRHFRTRIAEALSQVYTRRRTPKQQLGLLKRQTTLKNQGIRWGIYRSPVEARGCLVAFPSREVPPSRQLTSSSPSSYPHGRDRRRQRRKKLDVMLRGEGRGSMKGKKTKRLLGRA